MASQRWKTRERLVARALGTERLPSNGTARPDAVASIGSTTFSIEHKSRESLPGWFTDAMAQAVRNAVPGSTAMLTITAGAGPGKTNHRYVVLRLEDVAKLVGTPTDAPNGR